MNTRSIQLLVKEQDKQHNFVLTSTDILQALRSPLLYIGDEQSKWIEMLKSKNLNSSDFSENDIIAVDLTNKKIYDHQNFIKTSIWKVSDFIEDVSDFNIECEKVKALQFIYERRMIPNMGIDTISFPNMDNPDVFCLGKLSFNSFIEVVTGKNQHGFKFNDKQVDLVGSAVLDFQSNWRTREYGFEDKSKSIIRFKNDIALAGF